MTYTTSTKVFLMAIVATSRYLQHTTCSAYSRAFEDDDYPSEDSEVVAGDGGSSIRACPFGWEEWGEDCYSYMKVGRQWSQAEKDCALTGKGAHLVSILSNQEVEFLFALVRSSGTYWLHKEHQTYHSYSASNDFIWVGLAYMCPSGNARWTDGSRQNSSIAVLESTKAASPYDRVYSTGSSRGQQQQRCVALHMHMDGAKLIKSQCTDFATFICKMPKDSNKTRGDDDLATEEGDENDQCAGYDYCQHNDSCYKILTKEQSWYESRSACQADGGDLVSIHSSVEIEYINNNLTVDWNAGNLFWTGLNKLESFDDRFQWSDNSPIDFLPHVNVDVRNQQGPFRTPNCVSLRVSQLRRLLAKSTAAGKMRELELQLSRCDTNRPAICKRPTRDTKVVTVKPNVVKDFPGGCPKGWLLFRNRCYLAFGINNETAIDRVNFREAHARCEKAKANLVSIKDYYDNQFILSLLSNEELNQSWIGLIYSESKLKWIDETEVAYTNFDAIGMAMFGIGRTTTPSPLGGGTTSSLHGASYYGSYPSSYLWRQQERCFVMSVDKAPGTWDPVSSSDILSSLIARTPTSGGGFSRLVSRFKRSMYWPYDWRRSLNLAGDQSCERLKLPFICERSKSANETSGEREWLCDNEGSKANPSSFKHGSNCFEIVTDTPASWTDAKKRCEQSSATLTSILNQQEFAFLVSLMQKQNVKEFWIGMQVVGEENSTAVHAEWIDQWPVWITKWNPSPIGDKERVCIAMTEVGTDPFAKSVPYWRQKSCQEKLPFVCKHRQNKDKPPLAKQKGQCEVGWLKGSTQCYKVKKDDWTSGANAMLRCWREHNATLASFPTKEDWGIIAKNQELTDSKRRFFIGLMQKIHGGFEWIDGSPLDFVNWAPQEPRFGWNPSVEVCVEMDQNGLWYDAGCHETRHFICSKSMTEGPSPFSASSTPSSSAPSGRPPSPSESSSPSPPPKSTSSSTAVSTQSTLAENTTSINGSDALSSFRSSQKSKSASSHGVIAGIVICVLFLIVLAALGIAYFYRQHTQGLPLFGRRSADPMRFEILNERNDEY